MKCDVCGESFRRIRDVFLEPVGNGVAWMAHRECLGRCLECGESITIYNCRVVPDPKGFNGYSPRHEKCPRLSRFFDHDPDAQAKAGDSTPVKRTDSIRADAAATVVVVDDDQALLHALSRLIEAAGFRVLSFDRPSALLASAIPRANACMVVDIDLPEMNGSELCSALAASGRGLPAILITGRNDQATQRLIEEAHAVAALFKPFDERPLFDAIARALTLSENENPELLKPSVPAFCGERSAELARVRSCGQPWSASKKFT